MSKHYTLAGGASPHIVIRGETSPRLNPVLNSSQEAPQAAHIDWLAITLTPPPEAQTNPIAWLFPQMVEFFGFPALTLESTGKGWNGYTQRFNIGENALYGLIAYGGEKQRGTVHLELNATACALVSACHIVQQWGESLRAKITRVDLAHDDLQADVVSIAIARAWYEAGEFTNSGTCFPLHHINGVFFHAS